MSARLPLYQAMLQQLTKTIPPGAVPQPSVVRLALLVTGLLAATSTVLAQVAAALDALQLTPAAQPGITNLAALQRAMAATVDRWLFRR